MYAPASVNLLRSAESVSRYHNPRCSLRDHRVVVGLFDHRPRLRVQADRLTRRDLHPLDCGLVGRYRTPLHPPIHTTSPPLLTLFKPSALPDAPAWRPVRVTPPSRPGGTAGSRLRDSDASGSCLPVPACLCRVPQSAMVEKALAGGGGTVGAGVWVLQTPRNGNKGAFWCRQCPGGLK